jgi:hypothetical protein
VGKVSTLPLSDSAWLEAEPLEELYRQLGPVGAEDIVCRAMEELAARLTRLERMHRAADFEGMRKSVRSMAKIADQIGMRGLAKVAVDVRDCIDSGDGVALAATLSRLMRVGERSLTSIWDLQDITV